MKKKLVLGLVLTFSTIYSQSKKEQIQSLNFKIDSLNNVIKNNNLSFNEEVNNLKKENLQLSNAISKDKITFEEKISSVNDSLLILNNFNKNLNVKISMQKDLIELFNDAFTIENRDFDVYKDSKLFSQLLFISIIYRNIKFEKDFSTNRYGIVYGNRFIHSIISDSDKLIFGNEVMKYLKYYFENFSTNPNEYLKLENENIYDLIYSELIQSKIAFEPHKIENMSDYHNSYYRYFEKNDIKNILGSIRQPTNNNVKLNFQ